MSVPIGTSWSHDFTCRHFVEATLPRLPDARVSGRWGKLLALPDTSWQRIRRGDVVLWMMGEEPYHAGLFMGWCEEEWWELMHNGYDCTTARDDMHVHTTHSQSRNTWADGRGHLLLKRRSP